MKEIPLTQGKVTLVDDSDYERQSQWNWYVRLDSHGNWYAQRKVKRLGKWVIILMHREILGLGPGHIPEVDHINGDGLDNRRCNLRIASYNGNQHNRTAPYTNTSGYKGVSFNKRDGTWFARVSLNYKDIYLGSYRNILDAVHAADLGMFKYHGEFANTNFPKEYYKNLGML
jgi:hypothetical protein